MLYPRRTILAGYVNDYLGWIMQIFVYPSCNYFSSLS